MCGIAFVMRKDDKPAHRQVLKRYRKQKNRGSEGFGYIGVKRSGRVTEPHRFMFEHEMKKALESTKLSTILFHHRYPTSTPNVPEAAHPITVKNAELKYTYYVVHNGVISNDEKLKEAHEKLGYRYTTELQQFIQSRAGFRYDDGIQWNDSEALAIELARNIEGKARRTEALGAIAYIVLQVEKLSGTAVAMYFGTNGGNALTMSDDKTALCIASEGYRAINDNICYRYDFATGATAEYLQVQMAAAYQPPKTGYRKDYGAHSYSRELSAGYDESPAWNPDYAPRRNNADKTLYELEEEISDLEEELIGLAGDMKYNEAEGDIEAEEMDKVEYQNISSRLEKLRDAYARKANKNAAATA